MKEKLNKVLSTFTEFWKAQDKKRKIIYISALAGVFLVAAIITIILNTKHYVVLYEGLDAKEASEIVTEIQNLGVDATLSSDGKISVPKEQENNLRMQLATKGYPKSSLSYDVWNNNVDMFTTDYEKREQARMQLQERLQATIETLEGIDKAIVTLNIPEQKDTVITVNAQPSTASVVLHLKDGVELKDKQIKGIRYVVMKAVPNLTEENITITDGSGNLLVEKSDDSQSGTEMVALERNKLLFKQQFQETIKNAVLEQLVPAFGQDGVTVAVNANLDYDKKVSENTTYTPSHEDGSGMIQNQEKSNASGTNGTNGGVVGTETNADDTYPTQSDNTTGAWSETKESTNYLVNTLKQQIESQGFDIEKISVSVMVYTDTLSEDNKTMIAQNVANAAGTDVEFVSIGNLPKFGTQPGQTQASALYPFGWSRQQYIIFLMGLVILILAFTAMYIFVSMKAKHKRREIDRLIAEAAQRAGESGQVDGFFHGGAEDVASLTEAAQVETKEAAVRREIGEFAQNSPEIVAQLLKSWIREEADNNGGSSSSSSGKRGARR